MGWGEKRHSGMGASDMPNILPAKKKKKHLKAKYPGACAECLFSSPKWSASKTSCLVLGYPLGVQGWESFRG